MKEGHQGFSFFYALQKVRHKYLYVYDEKNVAYDENFQDPFRQVAKIFKGWRDLWSFYVPKLQDLGRMQNYTLLSLLLTQPFFHLLFFVFSFFKSHQKPIPGVAFSEKAFWIKTLVARYFLPNNKVCNLVLRVCIRSYRTFCTKKTIRY